MSTPVKTITQLYQEVVAAEAERQRQRDEVAAREKATEEAALLALFNEHFPDFAAVCAASGVQVAGYVAKYSFDNGIMFAYKSYTHKMAISTRRNSGEQPQVVGIIQPTASMQFGEWPITRLASELYAAIVRKGDEWEKNCEPFRTSTDPEVVALNYRANNPAQWVDFATFKDQASRNGTVYQKWAPKMSFTVPNPTGHPLTAEEETAYWHAIAEAVDNADDQDWPWNVVSRP